MMENQETPENDSLWMGVSLLGVNIEEERRETKEEGLGENFLEKEQLWQWKKERVRILVAGCDVEWEGAIEP